MKKTWIYAEQWGIFWRFAPQTFEKLLKGAIRDGHYDLDKWGLKLRSRPNAIQKGNGSSRYYPAERNVYYYHMVDTDVDDWSRMLDEVRAIMRTL